MLKTYLRWHATAATIVYVVVEKVRGNIGRRDKEFEVGRILDKPLSIDRRMR